MVFATLAVLLPALPAWAETPGLAQLGGTFDDVRRGIEALATSGSPRAAPVLEALQAGRLFARHGDTPIIRTPEGQTLDAETGNPVPNSDTGVRPIRSNNAVRRALDAALGGVRLFSPDAATRDAAATWARAVAVLAECGFVPVPTHKPATRDLEVLELAA